MNNMPGQQKWKAFTLLVVTYFITIVDAGVASGLLNTSQNLGGAIGVAVASSIAASRFRTLAQHGHAAAAALTGGLQLAMWVCGLSGLVAIPVAFVLIRRPGKAHVVATPQPQDLSIAAAGPRRTNLRGPVTVPAGKVMP
jgi:sugar phosphate permease